MKPASIATGDFAAGSQKTKQRHRLARRAVFQRLERLEEGCIVIADGAEERSFGDAGSSLRATVTVKDARFYTEVAFGGPVGGGEAYFYGYWQTDSLTAVVRILARNRAVLEDMDSGSARLARPLRRLFHWLNSNTRRGSRRNILAHYDLGNEFFELWLDDRMQYSSAIFAQPDMSLDAAQELKLDRLCRKLDLKAGDHLLEIGTGWGGLAIHAASRYGCRVTTTTISDAQYDYAAERIRAAGLEDRVTLLKKDYRELTGRFDKLVSVEMLEAVGHRFHDTYFRKCGELLKPDGLMVLQSITIADQRFKAARNSVDFIQRYIFPGGCLPSLTVIADRMTKATDLRITHVEDIGLHYATTLRRWHDRMFSRLDEVFAQGYSKEFVRMWQYYLCYCEGGFLERVIGNVQLIATKPRNDRAAFIA